MAFIVILRVPELVKNATCLVALAFVILFRMDKTLIMNVQAEFATAHALADRKKTFITISELI